VKNENLNLTGKVIFITGANTGIGKEAARTLSYTFAKIYLAARDESKMKTTIDEIKKENSKANLVGMNLDLGDSKSIDKCVKEFLSQENELNILINNAGVMGTVEKKTNDGFEYQIGINHFGHFRLTLLLLPLMKKSALNSGEGRIVNLSSEAHRMAKSINFDNINLKDEYGSWWAYGQSKLANIMFSNELNKRLKNDKIPISVNSLHPGVIQTEIMRDNEGFLKKSLSFFGYFFMKSIPQGASTTVYCAISKEVKNIGGKYFDNCKIGSPTSYSMNEEFAKKLFDLSEKMTGLGYADSIKIDDKKIEIIEQNENIINKNDNNETKDDVIENME